MPSRWSSTCGARTDPSGPDYCCRQRRAARRQPDVPSRRSSRGCARVQLLLDDSSGAGVESCSAPVSVLTGAWRSVGRAVRRRAVRAPLPVCFRGWIASVVDCAPGNGRRFAGSMRSRSRMKALMILRAARASRSVRRPLKYAASSLVARSTSCSRICCSPGRVCVADRLGDDGMIDSAIVAQPFLFVTHN